MLDFKKLILVMSLISVSEVVMAQAQVVTTIKPLHSLVAQITAGISEPVLLVDQGSPHSYQLKPSDVKAINEAALLVWVGHDMEIFVPRVLDKVGEQLAQVEWSTLKDIQRLPTRTGGLWETEHVDISDGHSHGKEVEHHATKDNHEHDNHEHDNHEHEEHEHVVGHHHGEYDPHLWLSIHNSAVLLEAVTDKLSALDQQNAAQYRANLTQALVELDVLDNDLKLSLAQINHKPYMVFHDAYQYFEHEYNLHSIGAVRVSPEHEPGAARIGALRELMQQHAVKCLFTEPQFPAKMAAKLVDNTKVKLGTLDPIGAEIQAGVDAYATLMHGLANSLQGCLR